MAGVLLVTLTGCKAMHHMAESLPEPKLPKIKLPDVTKVIPGLGSEKPEDPEMPFHPNGTLGYGHTLRVSVYDGSRVATKLYSGRVMVDPQGVIDFPSVGSAKVGGHTVVEARAMIASLFRSAGRTSSQTHVHLSSIEGTPLVAVEGDIAKTVVLRLPDKSSLSEIIAQAGGRRPGSTARSVYVSHEGQRRFYPSEAGDAATVKIAPGDIIILSPDL